jgi:hypothetical protein
VPCAIKDIIATADMPTTAHSRVLIGHQPAADATSVRRGGHVGGGNDVLDCAGHAMKWTQVVAGRKLILGRTRASERRIGCNMEERVDRLAGSLDAHEKGLRPVNR